MVDNGDPLSQMSEWQKYIHMESDFNWRSWIKIPILLGKSALFLYLRKVELSFNIVNSFPVSMYERKSSYLLFLLAMYIEITHHNFLECVDLSVLWSSQIE